MTDYKRYFQDYYDYFWWVRDYWEDITSKEEEVSFIYEIPEGSTIAYVSYVNSVLDSLSFQGLPPFGSLLLAIAATNHDPHIGLEQIKKILKEKEVVKSFPNANLYNVEAAFVFLNKLAALPAEYKTQGKRIVVFQTIFKNCHNSISAENAKAIVQEFKNNQPQFFLDSGGAVVFNQSNFIKDIKTLALLNSQFPLTSSIIKAMENLPDIEEVQQQLDESIPGQDITSDKPKDFVDQLIDNDKTFHVGSLMRRLWSGLKIPLHHNQPSNQPLGGIADITNKGDFDKLLISEFANDDLVFMSRIANNEALYIEREIPPEEDKFTRDILIDTSIKNWGNPKIVAFATALAVAKHPKTDIQCSLYVLGAVCEPIQHEDIHEVIDGLNVLSGKIDCSEGLNQYFADNAESKAEKETFLIISEESYKSASFQKVLHQNFESLHYIITTNVYGEVNIYKVANKGRKLIQKMQLPLEELWRKNAKASVPSSVLPLSTAVPILYPLERNYQNIFHCNSVYYTFSNKTLYQFVDRNTQKGFIKLADGIPLSHGKFGLYLNDKNERILVNSYDYRISRYNVETGVFTSIENPFHTDVPVLTPFVVNKKLYVTDAKNYWEMEDKGGVSTVSLSEIEEQFQKYTHILESFIHLYTNSRTKFNIIRKLQAVWYSETIFEINDFALFGSKFTSNCIHDYSNFESMESKVNLYFKRNGEKRIETLRTITEMLKISLKEATELINTEKGLLMENVVYGFAYDVKDAIEETGAVCYTETSLAESDDGSTVIIRDGIAELESSNKSIPKIYIAMVTNKLTAMATDEEFAGNDYFLPENSHLKVISENEFHEKYIKPFVKTMADYATDD